MVDRLSNVPLTFEPGTEFLYGLNSDVLGYLVEVVSGKPYDQFLEEKIFNPLEMNDTGFFVDNNKLDRLAAGYTLNGDGNLERIGEITRELALGIFVDEAYPYTTGDTYFSGGAGLTSTPDDFVRFLQMLLNDGQLESKDGQQIVQIATPETIDQFLSIRPDDPPTNQFFQDFFQIAGYKFTNGFVVKDDDTISTKPSSLGSFYWAGLLNTHYFVDPELEMIGVIMTQIFPYDPNLMLSFEAGMYEALVPVPEPSSLLGLLFIGGLVVLPLTKKRQN